ncbi:hydantoinase/oxoprolinase family protein [Mesorhizobium sp.]|uniref:hydantoinase/oxoprolinase family protein n=1 Tax=Mesorhizobium sp. TaxID=1871066 RepID=UPI0025E20E86|nr:hydantoinase/oxoprolinase family protein [Mesorhizobium sp.]
MDTSRNMTSSAENGDWKLGVDIGGTFIDFFALEAKTGRVATLKVLTTPNDPGAELMTGIDLLAEREGLEPEQVNRFVHGTTVGINTIIQRKGARLALITNAGFEDVIELARLRMPDMYSLFCHRPDPLISRDLVFGVRGRMSPDGKQALAPDLGTVSSVVEAALRRGVEGIIVSFLHSWRNPAHEDLVKAEIARLGPGLFVFTSSEVWPVIREYERTSTAILNGYVHPRVATYLRGLEERLAMRKVPAQAMLTKSNGGLMNAAEGRQSCVNMLLSGTASGVIGAGWLARQAGESRILTLDIGGTSSDFALIIDGEAQFGTGELIGEFPLYLPSISVSSIGIGGGSIATVDDQGVLRVGPESAGSLPGPACYGRGGVLPTITDAMAVCGWLGHSQMAYGQLSMDVGLARAAVETLAVQLGRTVEGMAQAILDVAISELFVEVEKLSSRAGVDLRDFTLMPFGGGGPMLGAFLAREIGMRKVMVVSRPGVVSALGGLVADLRGDFIRTVFAPLSGDQLSGLAETLSVLAEEGRAWLSAQGHRGAVELRISADMRYAGQSYEIEVPLEGSWFAKADPKAIEAAFHEMHQKIYAFHDASGTIEIVNLRLAAIGAGPRLNLPAEERHAHAAVPSRFADVHLDGKVVRTAIFDRADLTAGAWFCGPAIVAQEDTTFAVPPTTAISVDAHNNLQLTFGAQHHV